MTGILFDLDGTLLNTLDDLMDAVNHTMEVFGYPRHSREEVRRFVGNGAGRLLQLSVPQGRDWQELSRATIGSIARSKPLLIPASWKRCTP
jgi:phosphoglycolate phosphatase-like HAD superfamily hydrolase